MSTVKIKDEYGWQSVASIKESDPVLPKDVNFYDYDGTLVYSYTASEFLIHNMMPALPEHKGLKGQEWNWPIEKARSYVSKYGRLNVGATYITDDGKTRFYISIVDPAFKSLRIIFSVNGVAVVDWGDGSTETVTGTSSDVGNPSGLTTNDHTYESIGNYVITLDVNGSFSFLTMSAMYNNYRTLMSPSSYGGTNAKKAVWEMLTKLEIGRNINIIGDNAFSDFHNLNTVTIPKEIVNILSQAFRYCDSLKALIVPAGKDILSARPIAIDCHGINIIVYPATAEYINGTNTCLSDYCLKSFIIPDNANALVSGFLSNCYRISSIIVPSSINTIQGNAFNNCALHEIHFTPVTPPTIENSNAFNGIPSACKIYVPTGSLSAYTSATNYPDPSTYTYIGE